MFLVILLYLFFGISFTILKFLFNMTDPLTVTFWRLLIAGGFFIFFYFWRHRKWPKIKVKDRSLFFQFTLIAIYLTFTLGSWAVLYISSIKACFYYNLAPFVTAIIAYFWYGRTLSIKKIAGIIVSFLGFIPYLRAAAQYESESVFHAFIWLPDIAMALAVISYAYGWLLINELEKRGYAAELINGVGMLAGSGLVLGTMMITKTAIPIAEMSKFIALLLLLILVGNIIFYALYSYLLHYYRPTFLSFMGIIAPLFAGFFGWIFLSEPIPPAFFVTIFIVALGLFIFNYDELMNVAS
ncbi:MAG: DMT family transporter [Candidatus Babeliales bacterium]